MVKKFNSRELGCWEGNGSYFQGKRFGLVVALSGESVDKIFRSVSLCAKRNFLFVGGIDGWKKNILNRIT